VLLLDEPLAALDAVLRDRLRVEIADLLRQFGITAIYVTHDQAEAMAIGDRIAVMNKGKIAQIGRPEEIYHRPSSAFVADFVGTMNRISGEVQDGRFAISGPFGALNLACKGADRITQIGFRPEAVRLCPRERADLTATVQQRTFFGATQRLVVKLSAGIQLQLDLPSSVAITEGERLGFTIDADALIEFPTEV
jgi:putative spermidine/putrescine transport system ATP-binding protein